MDDFAAVHAVFTLKQAILLGGICWLLELELGFADGFLKVLWAGLLTGFLLGNVKLAAIQTLTVLPLCGWATVSGWKIPDNTNISTYAIFYIAAQVIGTGNYWAMDTSFFLMIAHTFFIRFTMILFDLFIPLTNRYIENGNAKGIYIMSSVFPWVSKIVLTWIPVSIGLYFGMPWVESVLASLPAWLSNMLNVSGQLLFALGIAYALVRMGGGRLVLFFVAGFFFVQYANQLLINTVDVAVMDYYTNWWINSPVTFGHSMPIMATTLLGAFIAFVYGLITYKKTESENDERISLDVNVANRCMTKRDIFTLWARWFFFANQSISFARAQGLALCCAFLPILKRLYGHDSELFIGSLQRHSLYYQSHGVWGGFALGLTAALEEQRAAGQGVSEEMIYGVKYTANAIERSYSGLNLNMIVPVYFSSFIYLRNTDNHIVLMIVGLIILIYAVYALEGFLLTWAGYRTADKLAGRMRHVLYAVVAPIKITALFALGGWAAHTLQIQTPLSVATGGQPMQIQHDILDTILPGLLPILAIVLSYLYLLKGGKISRAVFVVVAVGMLFGFLGLLGESGILIAQST